MQMPTLADLRRYAIARTLFAPTTLLSAIRRLGFVQADPIRAPARAQDLTLRHRVRDYRAGDLERRYASLAIEEDFLVNYGFLPREHLALMHPRRTSRAWSAATRRQADALLAYIRERGSVHPREVDQQFAQGRVVNYWGGTSSASTHLLGEMHRRGLLRVARRDNGTRIYSCASHPAVDNSAAEQKHRAEALLDLVLRKYAPLPAPSLTYLARLLISYGAPHLAAQIQTDLRDRRAQLASCKIDGVIWYWPADERPESTRHRVDEQVRLLAPFDPLVWDRRRFELLWDWVYRFEAYTPPAKRRLGYYALPLLWHEQVIGWANLATRGDGELDAQFHYVDRKPTSAAFHNALDDEMQRMLRFLVAR